jgi:hypothetical protein
MLRADQHCVTTTDNRKYRLRLLTQAQQWRQGLTVLILGTRDNNPRRELHRLPGSERVRSELAFQTNTIFSALRTEGVVYTDFAEQTQALFLSRMSFPFPLTQVRLTPWCRECVTDNPCKGSRRFGRFRPGDVPAIRTNTDTRLLGSEEVRGFCCKSQTPLPFWPSLSSMEEEPFSRLVPAF